MGDRRGRMRRVLRERVDSGVAELVGDPERPRGWTLLLDGAPQSHVDLDDPTYLHFEYVRRLGHLVDLVRPPSRPVRVLHLGGGGLTLPRYVAATRPRSRQQVAEVDTALVAFVRRELPLDRTWQVRIRTRDARESLLRAPHRAFDLVVADVFAGARTPASVTSVEFVRAVSGVLDTGGWYAANITDGKQLAFARGQVATLRAVFTHACLIAESGVLRSRRHGNLVLVGSAGELPLFRLSTLLARDPHPARILSGPELDRFTGGARPVTDATAVPSPEQLFLGVSSRS